MAPPNLNWIQYMDTGVYQQILMRHGERRNRETIKNFILAAHGVDVGDRNYTLWFLDNAGNYCQVDPTLTIRSAFDVARTTLNGQRVVYLSLWNQCGLKVKSEVKEENF